MTELERENQGTDVRGLGMRLISKRRGVLLSIELHSHMRTNKHGAENALERISQTRNEFREFHFSHFLTNQRCLNFPRSLCWETIFSRKLFGNLTSEKFECCCTKINYLKKYSANKD